MLPGEKRHFHKAPIKLSDDAVETPKLNWMSMIQSNRYDTGLSYLNLFGAVWFFSVAVFSLWPNLWNGGLIRGGHLQNTRTLHLEEFDDGYAIGTPQAFMGMNWQVKAERASNRGYALYPISDRTCFTNGVAKITEIDLPQYKKSLSLCGPNLWHMQQSCKSGAAFNHTWDNYFDLIRRPEEKESIKVKIPLVPESSTYIDIVNGDTKSDELNDKTRWERCEFNKIKPLVAFEIHGPTAFSPPVTS